MSRRHRFLLKVNRRELATILAALRFHQDENLQGGGTIPDQVIADIATDGGTRKPLNAKAVDALCQRLNPEHEPAGMIIKPPDRERGPEPLFRVVYIVDVNSGDRHEAARYAHRIMADPKSQPPVLHVIEHTGRATLVDLSEEGQGRRTQRRKPRRG
ncbi:MAG: hypothetical protein K8T91_16680 [Planctomycetes bacterium]|nr:hypothetical protein [Planctomycetota bacterium]